MIRKIFAVFTILFFTTTAFAFEEAVIVPEMTKKIDKALTILKEKDLSTEAKGKKIISILDEAFDYKLMSRLSLGKKWRTLSSDQKNTFTEIFSKKLKQSYIDKLDLYTDQKVKILGIDKVKSTRIVLNSEIVGKDETYDIKYKFYKKKNMDEWFIYDVDIVGVSLIQTYRKQFSTFLKEKSIEDLISNLNQNI